MMMKLLLVLLFACLAAPAATLQRFCTFYRLDDPAVPAAVRATAGVLRVAASDGAVWRGTRQGLWRGDSEYFASRRYLPDDDVQHIVPDSAAGVWVRTATGISHIELRPMTLLQKTELFEERIRLRHNRHGMVSPSILSTPGDLTTSRTRDDDNDGLWTAMYGTGECFRYAVTKEPQALALARRSIEAVLFLEQVTGRPGFPARSYIERGEPMPRDGEWHWTADGKYYWKGDTSSDEIVGHFFLFAVAWDTLPADDPLRARIGATARRIMDHILANGYYLIDLDGKPTRWGKWSLDYFKEEPGDAPLNALELLSFLKTAHHITGDERYQREYRKAAVELGYAKVMTRLKEWREQLNYSDEELAMLPFYCLFRYEKDAQLLDTFYRPALDQWWENMSREANPLWTMIYLTSRPKARADLPAAIRTLERMPIDLLTWTIRNSHREDVVMTNELDRFQLKQAATLLPPDERPVMKWNANPFIVDGGNGGRGEDDGAAFLLPYWLGRYHRYLTGE
ncbi:MAG: hypothetical protein IPP47_25575 [Bryobacterales bacterium]|nr:hypothetical protein [Bryobacterales bacterium]